MLINREGNTKASDRWRVEHMVAYEFYWRDSTDVSHSIGILPERRKNSERITADSIMRWGKIILGENAALTNLVFT